MKKFIDKALKIFAISMLIIISVLVGIYVLLNDSVPMGSDPIDAQKKVTEMHKALNISAWNSTKYISWMTNNSRHYIWDKQNGYVQVRWKGYRVIYHQTSKAAKVYNNDKEIINESRKNKLLRLAKDKFRSDSYWFSAPYLVNEYQLTKDMVLLPEESKRSICIRFPSNHAYRNDEVYVYRLDSKNRPESWKMWNNKFILGGLETEWKDWKKSETGFYYPSIHKRSIGGNIEIQHFKSGFNFVAIGLDKNPFLILN